MPQRVQPSCGASCVGWRMKQGHPCACLLRHPGFITIPPFHSIGDLDSKRAEFNLLI